LERDNVWDGEWVKAMEARERWEMVDAALLAWPLREPEYFLQASHIIRWTRVEAEVLAHFGNVSRARHARGTMHRRDNESLVQRIIRRSDELLVSGGEAWTLRVDRSDPGREVLVWRGVRALLPECIVVAGAIVQAELDFANAPLSVNATPPIAAPMTRVAHLHVHLGPMLRFDALWFGLWKRMLSSGCLVGSSGDDPFVSMRDVPPLALMWPSNRVKPGTTWRWLLECAFVARAALDVATRLHEPIRMPIPAFLKGLVDPARRATQLAMSRDILAYARKFATREVTWEGEEARFLAGCFAYCRRQPADQEFQTLLCQYMRVMTALFRHVVVDPWSSSLRHFLDVVKRDDAYKTVVVLDTDRARLRSAFSESPLRVASIEVHVDTLKWLQSVNGARDPLAHAESGDPRRHSRSSAWLLSCTRYLDPVPGDGRFAGRLWRERAAQVASQCRQVALRLRRRPATLSSVRGLGLMGWEREGPVWLYVQPFRRLLEESRRIAAQGNRVEPLRTAMHLGEDFDHIITGLRSILEPFEWGLMSRGDRIGHGYALGLDPGRWVERNPYCMVRRWDRLVDIGFVSWAIERFEVRCEDGVVEKYRSEARRILDDVYPPELVPGDSLDIARRVWVSLQDARVDGRHEDDQDVGVRLVHVFLWQEAVNERALEAISVATAQELSVITQLQAAIVRYIARWQVAIEINPSSNLLIGGLRSPFDQPAFHDHQIPITISADDPLTFATTLADEYAYAWAGMVVGNEQRPVSPAAATERLERAARDSIRYSFVRPRDDYDADRTARRK